MKKFVSMFLAVALCFSLAASASAAGSTQALTSDNIEHVDLIFQNNARLLDETGKDITNEFILENNDSYRTGNYDAILDAIIDQNLAIEDLSTSPQPRLIVNGSVKSSPVIKYFDSPLTGTTTKEWIKFNFTGKYSYQDYNNTIQSGLSVNTTVLDKSQSSLTKLCGINSSSWSISNNNKTITFTVNYSAKIFISPYVVSDEKTGTIKFSKVFS